MKKNINRYCAMGVLFAGSMASAADVKVSGFVAPGYMWMTKNTATNTFGVLDGAVNLSASLDMVEAYMEIPVSTNMTDNTNNNFQVGMTKAQAYVGHKWENGFNYRLGQWQAPFGYEGVDITDRVLASASVLRSIMLPTTQTGLTVGYDFSDMLGLNLFWTNHANQGISGTVLKTDGSGSADSSASDKYDFGFKVASKLDMFKASVGMLWQRPAESVNNLLFDIVAGTKVGNLGLDLDVVFDKLTNVAMQFGISVQGVYSITDMVAAAVRVEWLKAQFPSVLTAGVGSAVQGYPVNKALVIGIGPQFAVNKAFNVRVDYVFTSTEPNTDGATSTTGNGIDVAAVYKF